MAARCQADPAIRCVVLTGNGKLFCGGGDVASFAAAGEEASAFISELAGTLHLAMSRFLQMPKPFVVLVNGPAAGAGLGLAVSGDIVIAARSAQFSSAYGQVGLTPDGGASWLLPRLIGLRRAQEVLIGNRSLSAEEGAEMGLVTRVVDDEELTEAGQQQAAKLARAPNVALGRTRMLMLEGASDSFESHLERETRSIAAAAGSKDGREGVAAFLERRKPVFTGE